MDVYDRIANLDLNSTATRKWLWSRLARRARSTAGFRARWFTAITATGRRASDFAWVPKFIRPKTVVRGGYSIFYNEAIYNTLAQQYLEYEPPFATSENLITSGTQVLTLQNGFPSISKRNSEQGRREPVL